MKKRYFLQFLLWLVFALAHPECVAKPPNIIFLFADDQAYDTLGCYGNPDVRTPNIDRLGHAGLIFDRHYNTTAICMASRANVMTGLLEYRTGCNFMHGPMMRSIWEQSYPVRLRAKGYRTGFGGKFGFAVADAPGQSADEHQYEHLPLEDFDFWVGGVGQTHYATEKNKYLAHYADRFPHSTRAYGAAGIDFIRTSSKTKQPFCLTLFFKAPHRPTTPDPAFDDVYKATTFRKLPNYGRAFGNHLAPQSRLGRQYPRFEEWGYHTEASYQKAMRTYHQQIYGIDVAVGMILDELEIQGIADETVIIYSSDNGFFNGSHGLGSKVLPYEEGARVPMVIFDPRVPVSHRGRRTTAVSGNIDIAATIMDLAGIENRSKLDGQSLMPLVRGQVASIRERLPLIQVWGATGSLTFGVVTQHYKYLYWCYGEGMQPREELFDLQFDPYEMRNLLHIPTEHPALPRMRAHYASELALWKQMAVPFHGYQPFGIIFDPEVPWARKRDLLPTPFKP
ncbi:MAG: sulfatase [Verrucomicrobiota bacterium]|jgi:arylsulfatase A-like enzyme|nr:sulfatase [Verrucomicrobiota bacterium]